MNREPMIEVRNVTKSFRIFQDKGHTIKEKILFSARRKYEKKIVLDRISFSIEKGEAVGLIGENGCGKSTTLKLLTKIMYPDSGEIFLKGRVSSLIELGAGFHPDMSGRENIYINASIFGLTKKEIDERLQNIIEFSELGEYIDNPVRTYSSGMYMRLAFSVAINVDAEILLIDEILAVGDANFQAKCFNKLKEIKNKGVTIVIVSHSMSQIEQICDRSIWISEGIVQADGRPKEVHSIYMDYMGHQRIKRIRNDIFQCKIENNERETWVDGEKVRWGNRWAEIEKCSILDESGKEINVIKTGQKVTISVWYRVNQEVKDAVFGLGIFRTDGLQCYGTNTKLEGYSEFSLKESGKFEIIIDNNLMLPGEYNVDLTLEMGLGIPVDYYTKAIRFVVYSEIEDVGVFRLPHKWKANAIKGE